MGLQLVTSRHSDHAQRIIVHGRSNRRVKRDGMWIDLSDVESSWFLFIQFKKLQLCRASGLHAELKSLRFCTIRAGVEISCEEVKALCFKMMLRRSVARSDTNRESTPQGFKAGRLIDLVFKKRRAEN